MIRQIASGSGEFSLDVITSTAELSSISAANLAAYDVLFFANTSGELPLDAAQRQAVLDFVASGKGFVGTHSATDTFHAWSRPLRPDLERSALPVATARRAALGSRPG